MSLTALQWRFIAARLLCSTDKEAAELIGIRHNTPSNWKLEYPEFAEQYEAAFKDGVHVAQEYSRKLLGKAVQRHDEALDANRRDKADHATRLTAAKNLLQIHGLLKNQQVHSGDPDNPVRVEISADDLHEATKRAKGKA